MPCASGSMLNKEPPNARLVDVKTLAKRCFSGILTENPVLVAVSGGSDSIALLLLANAWALKNNVSLHAVTVDHGLRPEAAAEAAFVSGICAGLDIPHVTLAWEGVKPNFGVQEAARRSRYLLMEDYAQEIGADVILTGHTLDDQAETVFMRAQRNSEAGDGRGLAGMARQTFLYGGLRLVRPLLGIRRKRLRKLLTEFAQPWIDDPTNHDDSYERVRIRKKLRRDPRMLKRAVALGEQAAGLRRAAAASCADYLKRQVRVLPGPVFELALPARLAGAARFDPILGQAVQVLLALAGGGSRLVPRRRLAAIETLAALGAAERNPAGRVTLGGAVVEGVVDRKGLRALRFYREARNLGAVMLEPGEAAIWDGRLQVANDTALPIFVEAASPAQISQFERQRRAAFKIRPRQVLRSTPVIHTQEEHAGSPLLPLVEAAAVPKGLTVRLAAPAVEHFCPEFDTPLRDWVQSLDQYPAASLQP